MKKDLNEYKDGKQSIERIKWTDWALIDENGKVIGDKPENYPGWVECPTCGNPMTYSKLNIMDDFFECCSCMLLPFKSWIVCKCNFTKLGDYSQAVSKLGSERSYSPESDS